MIRVKSPTVRLNLASAPIRRMLQVLSEMTATWGDLWTGDLVVTSGNDGRHGTYSRHYTDEAIDVRAHNFVSLAAKRRFRAQYEAALGPQFRVLLESVGTPNEHFHAQVRKGHRYVDDGA